MTYLFLHVLQSLLVLSGCGGKDDTGDEGGLVKETVGQVMVGSDSLTDPLAVTVPDGAVSGLLDCGTFGDDTLGTVYSLLLPDGSSAYSYDDPLATPYRASTMDDLVPALIPESPDLDIAPGGWTLGLYVDSPGTTLTCNATWRTSAPGSEGTLDLDIYLAGVGIDAASAGSDAGVEQMLASLDQIWSAGGLAIGEVAYHDVNDDRYAVIDITDSADAYAEFNDLLRTSSPGRDRTVNLFLVQEISDFEGATIYGLSAGPPGAATVHGTSKSGLAVGAADLGSDPSFTARVAAHELGHFLGLFHTTEKDASSTDPLSDTAECGIENDTNGNGQLNTSECEGRGADNLLFWTGEDTGISADQGWVVVRSPAVR